MLSTLMKDIVADSSGATAIEYGMIAALITLTIAGSLYLFASETIEMWEGVASNVAEATGP